MNIVQYGLYFISDDFFMDFAGAGLKDNKKEKRPHYFCMRDQKTGLFWVIPLTSSEDKIELMKQKFTQGKYDLFHPSFVGGKPGVLLIQDAFPVTEAYFAQEYTVADIHYVYKDQSVIDEIHRKFTKILALKRRGVKLTPTDPDIFAIERRLLNGTTMAKTKK
jgi:hypothetical protein